MKIAEIGLFVIMVAGVAFTAALVHQPARPPAAAPAEKPVEQEHFKGSADTFSPAELRQARLRNKKEMAEWNREVEERWRKIDQQTDAARARPRSIRLPPDYRWGRCLLVVEGETRISGSCAYSIEKNGGFSIEGPRQIYGGIDYPKALAMAEEQSNDYWASVFKDVDGSWTGYGNDGILGVHGGPLFGPLRRQGACFIGRSARICLWKTPPRSASRKKASHSLVT